MFTFFPQRKYLVEVNYLADSTGDILFDSNDKPLEIWNEVEVTWWLWWRIRTIKD